jgi:hypothetical protein
MKAMLLGKKGRVPIEQSNESNEINGYNKGV